MEQILVFLILSLPVFYISRKSLFNPKSHGFYRFFAWECILWLLVNNIIYWFKNPFNIIQIISWILLIIAGFIVIAGVLELKRESRIVQRMIILFTNLKKHQNLLIQVFTNISGTRCTPPFYF